MNSESRNMGLMLPPIPVATCELWENDSNSAL